MSAHISSADHQALAASTEQETANVEAATTRIRQARSWEPSARRFRDLTEDERKEQEEEH